MKTLREKQEHMLHYVCGIDFDTLEAMSDDEVKQLYVNQIKSM